MIKTILVDDHKLFCDGLEKLLTETGEFQVLQKFYNGRDLLENLTKNQHPDLLVLDIEMPGFTGLDAISRIKLNNPAIKIVMLSMHEENVYAKEAFSLGADAYLIKSIESRLLIESLHKVMKGEKLFPYVNKVVKSDSPLSEREEEVLRLISRGKTSEEIAEKLNISPLTVKAHRRNMIRKLNAKNSSELMTKALEQGLL